ncbi:MAG: DNA polymerase III subunit alpha [Alphaproteobacteria bacterium]|nr:DNA polymerase III subunit alpha [Alphaproteobacteria bacterium]
MRYAELAVTTNFSFLRGASHAQEHVITAAELGYAAIGIADRNTLAGVVRAYDACETLEGDKPKLLVGARLVFADGTPDILAYPVDRAAYGNLCRLLTEGKLRARKGECTLFFQDLLDWQEGLLLVVMPPPPGPRKTASQASLPPPPRGKGQKAKNEYPPQKQSLAEILGFLGRAYPGRVWLGASMLYRGDDGRRLKQLQRMARATHVPLLATNDALYHIAERRELQDVVTCIREHVTLTTAGRLLEANAERHLKAPQEMARIFREAPDAIAETLHFANRISFTLKDLKYNYPDEPVPKDKTPQQFLEELTWEGAKKRYPKGIPEKIRAVLRKELDIIEKLDIAPYFLTVRDIVGFANRREILCQGRGSAANSAVCFVLGITAVDPAEFDLLFERFVSQERREPPDIDVDFEHERREEVIQDIYRRYGHDRAALTATVICYRPRSAIREVGKVFGLTEDVTAAMASGVWGSWGHELKEREVKQGSFDPGNALIGPALEMTNALIGFPRHLSQHVGGFVLTRDRLDTIVPIGPAAMDDRYFIEWDKDDIDRLGMMKVDVLALGMLTCIRKTFDLIRIHEGKHLELATVPREDPAVYDMLCKADAIGVFQVESRAQMNMLPRLAPRKFYDLVVEVAIVRPGPIQGNMVHPYLKRRSGLEPVSFPSPSPEHGPPDELVTVLGKTMGVPLFQEQAMKLAIVAARFTPDEANGLRRAMATFRNVGTIDRFRDKMVEGMVGRGYEREFAERCFKQIEGFGSYGFPESHAASFAYLAYVSAWLKCHHPAAFACALLNAQPMGFYAPAEIVRDAREHGVEVFPPDINFSHWNNVLERNRCGVLGLRLGFRQIDGFSEEHARALVNARGYGYASLPKLVRRSSLLKPQLLALAEADALGSLGMDRREALWAVRRLAGEQSLPLFTARRVTDQPGEDIQPLPSMPLSENVLADYQTLRLSLKAYPTEFLRERFQAERIMDCASVQASRDGARARCCGVVLVRQMPGAKGVVFVTLSDETGVANVVIWPSIFKTFRKEVMGARLLLVEGKVQRSVEGVVHLVAERMVDRSDDLHVLSNDGFRHDMVAGDIPPPPDSRAPMHRHPRDVRVLPKSRDFH